MTERVTFWYKPRVGELHRILEVTQSRVFLVPVEGDDGRFKYVATRPRELVTLCAQHRIEPTDPRLYAVPYHTRDHRDRLWTSWRLEYRP